jgi:hypothetical protein
MIYLNINGIDGCMVTFKSLSPQTFNVSRRNEREKLAVRYRKFHLGALLDVAAKAKGDNGRSCTEIPLTTIHSSPFLD